jgi:hypothetical protein
MRASLRVLRSSAVLVLLASLPLPSFAGPQGREDGRSTRSGHTAPVFPLRGAVVFGYVWTANDTPIPSADVRLRNLATGRVAANAVTNETGEFRFKELEGGTYVVEYVDSRHEVLAVGHVFSVAAGEAVATFIRLEDRSRWFADLLGSTKNAAAMVVASAASIGVTAVAPAPRAVTPNQ